MKSLLICVLVVLMFGCSTYKCQQLLPEINKIIINIDTSTALMQEQSLQGNYLDSLKSTIAESAMSKLEKSFSKAANNGSLVIALGNACSDHAVLVEGKLFSMTSGPFTVEHRPYRPMQIVRRYSGVISGRISDCSTGKVLAVEKIAAENESFADTPIELGEELGKLAHRKISKCE